MFSLPSKSEYLFRFNNVYKAAITLKNMNKKHWLTIISILYIIAMIIGAIIPNPSAVPGFSGNTKIFHFIGFFILAIMVLKTIELYKFKHYYILGALCLLMMIYITEWLQTLVPTRHFLYTDMLIDGAGCLLGLGVYRWIFYKQ
jgi:VanZ family protein